MYITIIAVILILLFLSLFTVKQQSASLIERFGKFVSVRGPGLQVKIPFIDRIAGTVSLQVQQLNVQVETKTLDNVFIKAVISVQYFAIPEKVFDAFYKLSNHREQITSFVFDVVRAKVPKLKLDEVFDKKDDIADAVKAELTDLMDDFGYGILKALVTDIDPDDKVKLAMNEINAAQRLRVAATEKGEAEKIIKVKSAEADAESAALQGQGIANQRRAIVEGLSDSIDEFQKSVSGTSAQDVMNLVLMTQYFDTLKDISLNSKGTTIMLPHSPAAVQDIEASLRNAILSANAVNSKN